MRFQTLILILGLWMVGACDSTPQNPVQGPSDPQIDPRTGVIHGSEPAPPAVPESDPSMGGAGFVVPPADPTPAVTTPFWMLLPKTWHRNCLRYAELVAQATYRRGDKHDHPMMYMVQIRRESACDPDARSPVGAQGLGQIMPATQRDLRDRLRMTIDVWDAAQNIEGALVIDQDMRRFWNPAFRSWCDRVMLMWSGYNSGNGGWLRAQKRCTAERASPCNDYYDMAEFLPQVNPVGASENLHYVEWISRNWRAIMGQQACPAYDATYFLPRR